MLAEKRLSKTRVLKSTVLKITSTYRVDQRRKRTEPLDMEQGTSDCSSEPDNMPIGLQSSQRKKSPGPTYTKAEQKTQESQQIQRMPRYPSDLDKRLTPVPLVPIQKSNSLPRLKKYSSHIPHLASSKSILRSMTRSLRRAKHLEIIGEVEESE